MPDLTVTVTDDGWKVVGYVPNVGSVFTAELPECTCPKPSKATSTQLACTTGGARGYHREHVETFLRRVAATYKPKPTVPEVPARR